MPVDGTAALQCTKLYLLQGVKDSCKAHKAHALYDARVTWSATFLACTSLMVLLLPLLLYTLHQQHTQTRFTCPPVTADVVAAANITSIQV